MYPKHSKNNKITRAKWTGNVAYVVECLLCKPKALRSGWIITFYLKDKTIKILEENGKLSS
jgi:phage-related holin